MRVAKALRGLLAATNDKAYQSPDDQRRVTEAEAALAEYDAPAGLVATTMGTRTVSVADQRAAFVEAMTWAVMP